MEQIKEEWEIENDIEERFFRSMLEAIEDDFEGDHEWDTLSSALKILSDIAFNYDIKYKAKDKKK